MIRCDHFVTNVYIEKDVEIDISSGKMSSDGNIIPIEIVHLGETEGKHRTVNLIFADVKQVDFLIRALSEVKIKIAKQQLETVRRKRRK